uniref:Protein NRT1/ PTR FAMILY 8.3-like n=1 Tax=Tanacetum cinerariifolium TaxID=118510 RepID=A0A699GV87_TANCI|nr:protein NRT1/ PTR FAMILY 8.3-like [Tanacetum cinerariifolium]
MFVEQKMAMDTTIGSFTLPTATLTTFNVISVIFWVPVYDRIIVPLARKFIASVEIKRLAVAKSLNLVNEDISVTMNIFWQAPQYIFLCAAEVFFSFSLFVYEFMAHLQGGRTLILEDQGKAVVVVVEASTTKYETSKPIRHEHDKLGIGADMDALAMQV